MGYYAELEVEREMWGCNDDDFIIYTHPTEKELFSKLASFVGRGKNETLENSINDFAESKGFDDTLCKSKSVERAKYNYVWNRRKAFKKYVQNLSI